MSTHVSGAQITITDHNDAVSIASFIESSLGASQVITNNDGTNSYNPNWAVSPYQVLTAHCYVGATDVAGLLSNRKWSYGSINGTSQGSGVTLTINSNILTEASPTRTYYFAGDYTDATTNLVSHIVCTLSLTAVKKGDSAIYVQLTGQTAINKSSTSTASSCTLQAGLYRNAGVRDTTNVTYKWYKVIAGVDTALVSGQSDVTNGYVSFKTEAGATASTPTTFADVPTIIIKEQSVTEVQVYRVEITDTNTSTVYGATFCIYDVSDPYDLYINSSAGDSFQNGIGSTDLTPVVKNGSLVIAITGWTFVWTLYNKDGDRGAFVNTTITPSVRTISANTTTTFTISSGLSSGAVAGQLVKIAKSDGSDIRFYEISGTVASGATSIPIRITGLTNTWASTVAPVASAYAGGVLFVCDATKNTTSSSSIAITGDDIDVKGNIVCEAYKPI